MTPGLMDAPPLVLVVEDDPASLDARLSLFRDSGCAVIGVRSSDSAIRELGASPQVNLVVTDIHLSEHANSDDRSGIALARYVRDTHPGLPIAGYSAHFAEGSLSAEELRDFDKSFGRGRQTRHQLAQTVRECTSLAVEHRRRRSEEADNRLEVLRRRYEGGRAEADIVRRLSLGSGESPAEVEAALHEAGYRLRLVEAGIAGAVREAFIVWVLSGPSGVEAEVYGHPVLYTSGDTEEEAVATLVELMQLFALDPEDDAADGPARELAEFLRRVLRNVR